jgi:hypothetical protein
VGKGLPNTKEGLQDAGYVYDSDSVCRGADCHAQIEFWITPGGRKMPMEVVAEKKQPGFFEPPTRLLRIPHWQKCPNAKDFRNARRS